MSPLLKLLRNRLRNFIAALAVAKEYDDEDSQNSPGFR